MDSIWDPDEVGVEWLEAVLREAGAVTGQKLEAVEAIPIGTGQVGCNFRYRLSWDSPGPAPNSVVGKFASRSEESRAAGVQTLTYETEVAFYRDLADTVDISRPGCFFADVEPGTANVALILEDIDGRQGDQIAGCSVELATAAVIEAARLHGPRWGDPALTEVPWLAAKAANPIPLGPAIAMMWPGFLERYRNSLSEESIEVGTRLAGAATWQDPHPSPATICHCDYRLDNILFSDDPDRPVTVVDWQTVQLGTGPADVAYFVSAALPPGERRRVERDLVATYFEHLSAYDIGDYTLDRCWEDYRRHSFSGFFMAVFASMVVGRTDRGDQMFMAMANGAAAQITDLGAVEFLS